MELELAQALPCYSLRPSLKAIHQLLQCGDLMTQRSFATSRYYHPCTRATALQSLLDFHETGLFQDPYVLRKVASG